MTADARLIRDTVIAVVGMVCLRLVAGALTPLTYDEAYYWTWSQHLAGGYYDHPPMVAVVIRFGTLIAGDTELGVRIVSVLLALPMSWAVFRTAEMLFGGRRVACSAALLLNATLIVAAGTLVVTPDAPLLVASAFVLFTLAKVLATGRGVWWLGVGLAIGCALLSKYTALFFGPVILIWLVAVPRLRRWLWSPWPYLGGIVAFAVFSPVILWNADHQWVSFYKQFGRARIAQFSAAYILELLPTQFALATPFVFVLGAMGLYALARSDAGARGARVLLSAAVWTIVAYFVWHSLHARVEGDWLAPVYPAFAIAAALAANFAGWPAGAQRVIRVSRVWAAPIGIFLFIAVVLQVNTGVLTFYQRDASVRKVGVGWYALSSQIEAARVKASATCVLASDYGTTAWLAFYLPRTVCVAQRNERYRWTFQPEPSAAALSGPLLVLDPSDPAPLRKAFARVEKIDDVVRKRGLLTIETIGLYAVSAAKGDVLDRSAPPELQR